MFESARFKLTAWYLLIIMGISIVFSYAIYTQINRELRQFEIALQLRMSRIQTEFKVFGIPPPIHEIDDSAEAITAARNRIIFTLACINLGILFVAGGAGYFLAGRTLKPIQDMLDDQNRFVTDASHELRTPLTSLKTTIEVNLREKKLTTEQAKEILRSNLEEVNTMQSLTDDLILLAQRQIPQEVAFEFIESKEMVSQAVAQVRAQAKVKQISIVTKGEQLIFEGDKRNIHTLLVILLENAIKYSPEKTTVTIQTKKKEGKVYFHILDNGSGIAKEDIPHVFERFYRAEKSRSRQDISGYGLGLSIAKKIVRLHQGEIRVKSEKNQGTTFIIALPMKQIQKKEFTWEEKIKKLMHV